MFGAKGGKEKGDLVAQVGQLILIYFKSSLTDLHPLCVLVTALENPCHDWAAMSIPSGVGSCLMPLLSDEHYRSVDGLILLQFLFPWFTITEAFVQERM